MHRRGNRLQHRQSHLQMLTSKQDVFMSSGMSTHPSPHSVVDGLPGGECSGLHHEYQQVDHRPAEPVDRHETCKATDPFVTAT